ncbi:MAG: ABC transporter ATP-binding protein [bacterium]
MSFIISANDIQKAFFKSKEKKIDVLKGVTLDLEDNKITVIFGASGAGKSTFLHILGGLDRPDNGEIRINGTDIFKQSDDDLSRFRIKNIGFVFQFHHLLPEFTAVENIAIAKMIDGTSLSKSLNHATDLLKIVGLEERANHKPAELSGGEQQRIAVARALVNNPKIVLADEPTGNLDSANSELIHKLFFDLRDRFGLTFLIVSHNPALINLGEIVYEMKDGLIYHQKK